MPFASFGKLPYGLNGLFAVCDQFLVHPSIAGRVTVPVAWLRDHRKSKSSREECLLILSRSC